MKYLVKNKVKCLLYRHNQCDQTIYTITLMHIKEVIQVPCIVKSMDVDITILQPADQHDPICYHCMTCVILPNKHQCVSW